MAYTPTTSSTTSTNNSSTSTLGANAVFTGTSDDALLYSEVRVSLMSNVASATNGLSVQQSPDGTNWDITDTYTITAAVSTTIVIPRQARYIRVVYTNGPTLQTTFRLQTILNTTATQGSSQRASDTYTNETDLQQNQSFNMLFNGTNWDRIRGDITNGIDVDVTRLPALVAGAATVGSIASITTSVVPGTAATNLGKAEDAVHASGDTGVAILAVRTDTPATTSSATGDYDVLHTNALGALQTSAYATTNGGATSYKLISAASTNATSIKASAGQIYMITVSNNNASARYLKLYNKASSPTVGTDTPVHTFLIPGGTAGAGTNIPIPTVGIAFGTGIALAITNGVADSDTGAVAANDIVVNIAYL